MTISGERTEQLDIFCRVTGFTSDFLSFIDVELIRFFHGALQLIIIIMIVIVVIMVEPGGRLLDVSAKRGYFCTSVYLLRFCASVDDDPAQ